MNMASRRPGLSNMLAGWLLLLTAFHPDAGAAPAVSGSDRGPSAGNESGEIFHDGFENIAPEFCNDLPPMMCAGDEEFCGEILPFEPVIGPGYDNYPINGETSENQYRSYARRDVIMLVKHAAAKVVCVTADWTEGNGGALGLGDMSESDGAIPGTSIGSPGHPAGSHENNLEIDTAYFQVDTPDNRLRSVCTTFDDQLGEQYHCIEPPHLLDTDRTALFLGYLAAHPRSV